VAGIWTWYVPIGLPAYRSGNIPSYGILEQAHNTTLEMASEMGIPFTILLGAAWLAIFLILGRGMLRRRRNAIFSISAFWIGLLAILHSQVDFPLQIPGLSTGDYLSPASAVCFEQARSINVNMHLAIRSYTCA
jgi:hypothetical protein